jgi:hypothetical protein
MSLPRVLLVASDPRCRRHFAAALREKGFEVSTARHIAEIERWPVGQVVVVDATRFTPLWSAVGAAHVVVLSDPADEEARVPNGVPSTWVPRRLGPGALISVLQGLR